MWSLAGVRMCEDVFIRISTFRTAITHKRLEILSWNLVHLWSSHFTLFVTMFMEIHHRFQIIGFLNFMRKVCMVALTFVKFKLHIVLKLHLKIIYIDKGTLILNFAKIYWSVKILRFYFVSECTDTKWWFYTQFGENRSRPEFEFFNFFIVISKFSNLRIGRIFNLWGSQNRASYFLNENTLWNW